jgi:hypothetical protein
VLLVGVDHLGVFLVGRGQAGGDVGTSRRYLQVVETLCTGSDCSENSVGGGV